MSFKSKQAIVTGAGSGIGAAAVQAAVDDVVDRAGRLDLMFNNAGIVWGGDSELLTVPVE